MINVTRFFAFIGATWWIIILTIIGLILAKTVTILLCKALKDSDIPVIWKIVLYSTFATIWAVLLIVAVPLIVRYLIGIY